MTSHEILFGTIFLDVKPEKAENQKTSCIHPSLERYGTFLQLCSHSTFWRVVQVPPATLAVPVCALRVSEEQLSRPSEAKLL